MPYRRMIPPDPPFLEKPFTSDDLLRTVARLTNRRPGRP